MRTDQLRKMIGSEIRVIIDRPLGSVHPKHKNIIYKVNYGYIQGLIGGDGEPQDVYVLGVPRPISEFSGTVIAVIHRIDDNEDKLIAVPAGTSFTKEAIYEQVKFQERYFKTEIFT